MTDYTEYINDCEIRLGDKFNEVDRIAYANQCKVLRAFQKNNIALRHFTGTSGYGYGDEGRDVLGKVYADAFGADAGIVSPHLLSGTHALTVALFGLLFPGDSVLCISGMPYDTIRPVISGEGIGSLKDYNINFSCVDLKDGAFDLKKNQRGAQRFFS